ncbi:hypothetical protein BC831DRAFT_439033 [Entophlyctis helioformis]|nr:hypothetical protein BC831DRAFT_439033 [Entophlyctis helioformis]
MLAFALLLVSAGLAGANSGSLHTGSANTASVPLVRRDPSISPSVNPCSPYVANLSSPDVIAMSQTKYKLKSTNETALSLDMELVQFRNTTDLDCTAKSLASVILSECPVLQWIDKKPVVRMTGNGTCCDTVTKPYMCPFNATIKFGNLIASSSPPVASSLSLVSLVSLLGTAVMLLLA